MKKTALLFVFLLFLFLVKIPSAFAIDNPTDMPNNKFGVHILFPYELKEAATLVNSNGGDWGYVTIPVQDIDKNLKKWQDFMDQARALHVIPIIRIATENYFFNTTVWRKPDYADILDFANFLNSLSWPTKNKYVIIFNEPNRGDEWGGTPNPAEYANMLSYAVTAFKAKSPDFFIISAGLDNAAANTNASMNEYTYLYQMNQAVPGIFNQIDGFGSHSYPNPAFAQPPLANSRMGISSFQYEIGLIDQFSNKRLPVFITETGWSRDMVPDTAIANYFKTAFTSVWNTDRVVAVTPFLLNAGAGPFEQFSLLKDGGKSTPESNAITNLAKVKGQPETTTPLGVLAAEVESSKLPTKKFAMQKPNPQQSTEFAASIKALAKILLHI